MKIINADAIYLKPDDNLYKIIEKIGRTCYKSEDKITNNSAPAFVKMLSDRNHLAMLEHATVYFKCDSNTYVILFDFISKFCDIAPYFKYIKGTWLGNYDACYVSASLRTMLEIQNENNMYIRDVFKPFINILAKEYPELFTPVNFEYQIDNYGVELLSREKFINSIEQFVTPLNPDYTKKDKRNTLMTHLTHSVKFTCDRGVSHELVRHRPCSFAQESTRYCNYSLDKHDNQLTFIKPCFWDLNNPDDLWLYSQWESTMQSAEKTYLKMISSGATAEKARSVLPNSLKTEIVCTATENEWQHILNLRLKGTTGAPHPQMKEIMEIIYPHLNKKSNGRLLI